MNRIRSIRDCIAKCLEFLIRFHQISAVVVVVVVIVCRLCITAKYNILVSLLYISSSSLAVNACLLELEEYGPCRESEICCPSSDNISVTPESGVSEFERKHYNNVRYRKVMKRCAREIRELVREHRKL